MKTLVIYDSAYGNTEKLAQIISDSIDPTGEAKVLKIDQVSVQDLADADLVVVGSPTQGGKPTLPVQNFLDNLPDHTLDGVEVAAFDTRFEPHDHGLGLRLLMKTIGFAAPRIEKMLKLKGGHVAQSAEGFIVDDKEGPLKTGEIDRAIAWARAL